MIISLSLPKSIIAKIDKAVKMEGYRNRSDFVRKAIEYRLSIEGWESLSPGVYLGVVMASYKCGKVDQQKLSEAIVKFRDLVKGNYRLVLDGGICVDTFTIYGSAQDIKEFITFINRIRGIEDIKEALRLLK